MLQKKLKKLKKLRLQTVGSLIGIALIALSLGYKAYHKNVLSFQGSPTFEKAHFSQSDLPASIDIPKRNMSVEIKPASISKGNWETSDDTASYLVNSSVPGHEGNIVVYAHNKKTLFGNLHDVDYGDIVHVRTHDGHIQKYEIRKKFIVSPDRIDVVQPTSYEVLTLFTCTGFADSQRLIIQAYPLS